MLHLVDGTVYQFDDLLEIASIGDAVFDDGKHIAMVAGEVLVVLRKELGVLESDDLSVE